MSDKELIDNLIKENDFLKSLLEQHNIPYRKPDELEIIKYSTDEKIDIFMSYFKGRDDIFAYQYINKEGKKGCFPFCGNKEKVSSFCKISSKCKDCSSRKYRGITKNDIFRHLKGEETLGIYPLLDDNTTHFICIDFDDKDYKKSALAFYKTCILHSIYPLIEISQSGTGAHIWIFFENKISAYKVRQACKYLLYEAMMKFEGVVFSSFDRMIPSQDFINTEKGYGNLIILPLQGSKAKDSKTIFVNENFEPYKLNEQITLLSNTRKTQNHIIDLIIEKNKSEEQERFSVSLKMIDKYKLDRFDFPETLMLIKENGFVIGKGGLSNKALKFIRCLASLPNPEYYDAMRRRQPIYNYSKIQFPMILRLFYEDESYIKIPRGCEEALIRLLNFLKIKYEIDDKEYKGKPIDISFKGELRFDQEIALNEVLTKTNGLIVAPPAFGKTILALSLIDKIRKNVLIVVPKVALINQWKERIEQFLEIKYKCDTKYNIGIYYGQKKKLTNKIDIACLDSLTSKESSDLLNKYGVIIFDEAHHLAAPTYLKCLEMCNSEYLYGFTATPKRSDKTHKIIYKTLGNIISESENTINEGIAKLLYPRFTTFYLNNTLKTIGYADQISILIKDENRNKLIVNDLIKEYKNGRTIMLLTDRIEHLNILKEMLKDVSKLYVINGEMSGKDKNKFFENIKTISTNFVVLSIGKYIGEGFDESKLDTMFIASPFKFKGTLCQYLGRLNRTLKGKTELRVFDYIDLNIPMFSNMYQERLRGYKELGYFINEDSNLFSKNLFNIKEFINKAKEDISKSQNSIKLFIKECDKHVISMLLEHTNAKATINITKNDSIILDNEIKFLITNKINLNVNCLIIDDSILWFGSNNMFKNGFNNDSVMRINNKQIIEDFLKQIK